MEMMITGEDYEYEVNRICLSMWGGMWNKGIQKEFFFFFWDEWLEDWSKKTEMVKTSSGAVFRETKVCWLC